MLLVLLKKLSSKYSHVVNIKWLYRFKKIVLITLVFLLQATKTVQRALSARQDLSFKGPRVQSKFNSSSVHAEKSVVKFDGLTDKRAKDQKALVQLA